ncbi:methyl-accepting chemotaxis protein [Devosia sp. CN2-171]|uniref:methyl-accepting chemotaxis protein n=1 Tax=Devosia sp. CN2-171 TaxID=3400909 RepID=UPI003BF81ADB
MPGKLKLNFPALKLRGSIILAAAAIFTIAIGTSLYYVVSSNRAQDLAGADEVVGGLAETEAETVKTFLTGFAVAADSTARTAEALLAGKDTSPTTYGAIVTKQLTSLPGALGVYMMFAPESALYARPTFAGSHFVISGNHVGILAENKADGTVGYGSLDSPAGFDSWFTQPLKAGVPAITGPDNIEGKLYTSFTNIIKGPTGQPVGMSGVAFDSAVLASKLGSEAPMGTGFKGIINQNNVWVLNPDPALIGTEVSEPWALEATAAMASAESFSSTGEAAGQTWKMNARKIDLPGSEAAWTMIVAVPQSTLLAASEAQLLNLLIGGVVIFALGLIAFAWLGSAIAKPIAKMTGVMRKVADGDYAVEVPYAKMKNEIGDMSKAVEVFRANGLKVAEMTEADAARIIRDQEARTAMMAELQKAFGQVVDAAVAGDFTRRVETEFPDAELNAIASSINNLVATVDRGLGETGEVLAALADTDLTKRMQGHYEGAFASLRDNTNAVGDKLSDIVGKLKETSRSLKTATGEILSGANDLSERTTKQAATIEETSAAMEQLATTVLQNSERAREASSVAGTVTRTAEEGGQVMGAATEAMERITQSSAKISNIIGLIDDIAFQTNLLALNASVEAARAGDAGKGFAVVAVEVRRLAQSAASASSEVKALIEQSGSEVKSGSKLVADAAARLVTMLDAARSSNLLMDGIAKDSKEQASAIEEVNTAVRQLDEMTQHNAALVEETNAAIEQTDNQVNELDRIVDIFTISGAPVQHTTAPSIQPARGIKGLQERVKRAASSYLSHGNAAIDKDWAEF